MVRSSLKILLILVVALGCKKQAGKSSDDSKSVVDDEEREDIEPLGGYDLSIKESAPGDSFTFSLVLLDKTSEYGAAIWIKDQSNFVGIAVVPGQSDELRIFKMAGGVESVLIKQPLAKGSASITAYVVPGRLSLSLGKDQSLMYDFTNDRDLSFSGGFGLFGGADPVIEKSAEVDSSPIDSESPSVLPIALSADTCKEATVPLSNLPNPSTGHRHWVALAKKSSAPDKHTYRFKYLEEGQTTVSLSTRGLDQNETYEVRLYLNWGNGAPIIPVNTVTLDLEPSTECILPKITETTVTPDKIAINVTDSISGSDWISIGEKGSVPHSYLGYVTIPSGSLEVNLDRRKIPSGTYVLRLFEDWESTKEYFVMQEIELTF